MVTARPARTSTSEAFRMLYLFIFDDDRAVLSTHSVSSLIAHAHTCGWRVRAISSPQAVHHLDLGDIERQTGLPVQFDHQISSRSRGSSPKADAMLVIGASASIIINLAGGFSDNYAMDVLNETLHLVPTAVLAKVDGREAKSHVLQESIRNLSQEGASVSLASDVADTTFWMNGFNRLISS